MLRLCLAIYLAALATPIAAAADRNDAPLGPGGPAPEPSRQDRPAGPRPERVGGADAGASLSACLEGTRRAACRWDRLTPSQVERVRSAEARQNLLLCLAGVYAEACRHELLSPAESRAVAQAEAKAVVRRSASVPRGAAPGGAALGAPGEAPGDLSSTSIPYAGGSRTAPAGVVDPYATAAPSLPDPRAGTSLARPSPDPYDPRSDPHGTYGGPRWPGGATDPSAMYGSPFRTGGGTSPYGAGGPAVLTPP